MHSYVLSAHGKREKIIIIYVILIALKLRTLSPLDTHHFQLHIAKRSTEEAIKRLVTCELTPLATCNI